MTDDVKAVAQRILDRTADQIGTHSPNCHEYHLPCFAAFVMRELEAASAAAAVDREALVRAIRFPTKFRSSGEPERWEAIEWVLDEEDAAEVVEHILASGILRDVRDVQAEALSGAALNIVAGAGLIPPPNGRHPAETWLHDRAQAIREARNG